MRMRPFGRLMDPERARSLLLASVRPVEASEPVALSKAFGRVAASELRARSDVPPFPRATWDGYAFRAEATRGAGPASPVALRVVGEVFAERPFPRALAPDEAVAIATGGALPTGADTVVIFEESHFRDGWLTLRRPSAKGARIAPVGGDFPRGARLAARGSLLTPAVVGALAAGGEGAVRVFRRPRVGLLPNGNELVRPGARRRPHQIFESNNLLLAGLVTASGGLPRPYPPLPDRPETIARALRRALLECDLVLVSGGSSVGEHDYLPDIFPRLGRLLFHGVAVRPGKPTLAALSRGRLMVGLPGHPTSCLANGFWLLLPVLRRLARLPGPGTVLSSVELAEPYEIEAGPMSHILPLRVEGGRAWPTFRDSSAITSLTATNAFVLLPPGTAALPGGARLEVELLLPPIGPGLPETARAPGAPKR